MAPGTHSGGAEREQEEERERERGQERGRVASLSCTSGTLAAHLKLAINWALARFFIYFCLAVDRRARGPRSPASPGRRGWLIKTPESH